MTGRSARRRRELRPAASSAADDADPPAPVRLRLLWLLILDRLRDSADRPRVVVLFGESLGAHTSQDVFLHWARSACGPCRALWTGTPYGSGWMHQLSEPGRLDVKSDLVAVVNDHAQFAELVRERGSTPRYVLVSHDNDGVTKFGLDLLATAPGWLGRGRPPIERVPDGSPRACRPGCAGGRSPRSSSPSWT